MARKARGEAKGRYAGLRTPKKESQRGITWLSASSPKKNRGAGICQMAQKAVREVQVPRASSGFVLRFYVEKNKMKMKMMVVLFFFVFSNHIIQLDKPREKKSFDALDHHPSLLKYIYWIFLYIFLFEGSWQWDLRLFLPFFSFVPRQFMGALRCHQQRPVRKIIFKYFLTIRNAWI